LENAKRLSDRAPEKEPEAVAAFREGVPRRRGQRDLAEANRTGATATGGRSDLTFFMAEAYTKLGEKDQAFVFG
jgi:hypothetical protein